MLLAKALNIYTHICRCSISFLPFKVLKMVLFVRGHLEQSPSQQLFGSRVHVDAWVPGGLQQGISVGIPVVLLTSQEGHYPTVR